MAHPVSRYSSSAGRAVSITTAPLCIPAGTGRSASGTPVGRTAAAAAAAATCNVLHLVLGPLDLNLLGLVVHLNQVVLDITAVSGPGNLLGNLLCGVAHLLDSNGTPGLVNNLGRILAAL